MKDMKHIPSRFKPSEFESKWQKKWEKTGIYRPDIKSAKRPYYNLMMFPYPSAEGLHIGNMYAFTGVDIHGRFMRMQGYDVFEPIGLDGFGIHSENYAIKVNRHPIEQAKISELNFYRQLRAIGNGFDWTRTVETYDPDYYRWTQWLFVQMFKHGLAYRAKAAVNYCPGCKTVLADEQVIDGKCERCSSTVTKKDLEQWFFRITAYAEKLLQNTYKPTFNWSERVKIGQRNWIGKKEGINICYQLSTDSLQRLKSNKDIQIEVFTTRPDTNYGATFIVISPEHPLVLNITTNEYLDKVKKYIKTSNNESKEERIAQGRVKTGEFTGSYAINNLNNEKMPIYVADFVLMEVGTGAVVGVPGHDLRDFEFATVMKLPIKRVVVGKDGDTSEITDPTQVQELEGKMINSGFLNGLDIQLAIGKMIDYLVEKGWGKRVTSYHLRDWLISRQRYWGAPIPMIYCENCAKNRKSWFTSGKYQNISIDNKNQPEKEMVGWYPVEEAELPVELPNVEDWRPTGTGRGPLAAHPEFYETKCPQCGGSARRETDVCDTFLDSAWYYLRYPMVGLPDGELSQEKTNHLLPWRKDALARWLPIDSYIGGAEHTVLHLLYTRFVWMALLDWGLLQITQPKKDEYNQTEPFKRFFAHGLIIKDGAKMSKSKGNVVVPDEHIKLYGADTLRSYLMFLGPFDAGGDFRDTGIAGMYKWLSRVWRLVNQAANSYCEKSYLSSQEAQKQISITISAVTKEISHLRYNTSIAKLMEFVNWWLDHPGEVSTDIVKKFLLMLAPFAPHMTEELWSELGGDYSIHKQSWPSFDSKLIEQLKVTIVVQVNGKVRDSIVLTIQDAKNQLMVEQMVKSSAKINKWLSSDVIKKTIFVPGKLINFVV